MKRPIILILVIIMALMPLRVRAEETPEELMEPMPAQAIAVVECTTGQLLFGRNEDLVLPASHMAKLMTLFIAAEKLDQGTISLTDTVTASHRAESLGGVSIWLTAGEKISLEELIKAITIGNANDAALTLAEYISGTEEKFVALMNEKAASLGMDNTHFADSAGLCPDTVSTAADIGLLCAGLSRYELLKPYLTCWMDSVREGKAELVNHNRLVRTRKDVTGFKACVSDLAGECAAVSARKEYLHPVAVILGADTQQNAMDMADILLDKAFAEYSLFAPEITEEMLTPLPVRGGDRPEVPVTFGELVPVIVKKGSSLGADTELVLEEGLTAPVEKGRTLGTLTVEKDGNVLYQADLTAAQTVPELSFLEAFKRLVYNLANMH